MQLYLHTHIRLGCPRKLIGPQGLGYVSSDLEYHAIPSMQRHGNNYEDPSSIRSNVGFVISRRKRNNIT